jgi:hypothetical protein
MDMMPIARVFLAAVVLLARMANPLPNCVNTVDLTEWDMLNDDACFFQ